MTITRITPGSITFNVTYGSNVSSANVLYTQYSKYGNLVHLSVPLSTSATKEKGSTILTVPKGCRPISNFYFQVLNAGSMRNASIRASTGALILENDWSSAVLWVNVAYICA